MGKVLLVQTLLASQLVQLELLDTQTNEILITIYIKNHSTVAMTTFKPMLSYPSFVKVITIK